GAVERHGSAEVARERPHVIEAEQVVGVVVREQDGVGEADALAQELQAQFRRRVDEDAALRRADEGGTAEAVVARVSGAGDGTLAAEHWPAVGGARAEEGDGGGSGDVVSGWWQGGKFRLAAARRAARLCEPPLNVGHYRTSLTLARPLGAAGELLILGCV